MRLHSCSTGPTQKPTGEMSPVFRASGGRWISALPELLAARLLYQVAQPFVRECEEAQADACSDSLLAVRTFCRCLVTGLEGITQYNGDPLQHQGAVFCVPQLS